MRKLFLLFILLYPLMLGAQSHNYWSRNFNEESSLLSGTVVGGGAGPAAIFYNPASISEINENKLSLNASLFTFDFINSKNALGEELDVKYSRGAVVPRFISYMVKPKKHPKWRAEIAFLNNDDYRLEVVQAIDQKIDILKYLPGKERHYASITLSNKYRDDWFGLGGSREINPNLFIGASMFVTVKSLDYSSTQDIEAGPTDSVFISDEYIPFYSASYQETELVKFNDYRVLWKFGLLYKKNRLSLGLNITTPSVGGIYSDGKRVMHKQNQSNITNPETGEPAPNYFIADYQEKKEVMVGSKSPFSVAAGITYTNTDKTKTLYTTVEYFGGIDPYRMVQANESPDLATGAIFENIAFNDFLSYIEGAKPIFNAGIGYRWIVKKDLTLLTGFRTDFNARKNLNYYPFSQDKIIKGIAMDMYRATGGLSVKILGQDIIAGLQYSFGSEKNEKQIINLSNPVEFNPSNLTALQGIPQNTMKTTVNSLSFYFGATFNFGGE